MGKIQDRIKSIFSIVDDAMATVIDYLEQVRQDNCIHAWRPALTSLGPARHCPYCDKTEQVTIEMYYAQFGTMPHKWY